METAVILVVLILGLIIAIALSLGFVGFIVDGICWVFRLTFTWKLAFLVWAVLLLLIIYIGAKKHGR